MQDGFPNSCNATQAEENGYEMLRTFTATRVTFNGSPEEGASRVMN